MNRKEDEAAFIKVLSDEQEEVESVYNNILNILEINGISEEVADIKGLLMITRINGY